MLKQLVQGAGLTGDVAVLRDTESIYVDRIPGKGFVQISTYVGTG